MPFKYQLKLSGSFLRNHSLTVSKHITTAAEAGNSDSVSSSDSSMEDPLRGNVEADDQDTASSREVRFKKTASAVILAQDSLQNESLLLLEFWQDTKQRRRNMLNVRRFRFETTALEQPPAPSMEIRQILRLCHGQIQPNSGPILQEQLCFALSHGGSMARVMLCERQGNRILSYNHRSRTHSLSPRMQMQHSQHNMAAGMINDSFLYVAGGQRAHDRSDLVNRFDFRGNSWTHGLKPLPAKMEIQQYAVLHGRLLVIGREIRGANQLVCVVYCPSNDSWEHHDDFLDECFRRTAEQECPYAIPLTLQGPENGNGDALFRLVRCDPPGVVRVQLRRLSADMKFGPWENISFVKFCMALNIFDEDFFIRGVSQEGGCFVIVRYRGLPTDGVFSTREVAVEFHMRHRWSTVTLQQYDSLDGKEDHVVLPFIVNC